MNLPGRTTDEQLRRWIEAGKTAHPDSAWLPAMAEDLLAARTEIDRLKDALIEAHNAIADGEPYGHVVAILVRAIQASNEHIRRLHREQRHD